MDAVPDLAQDSPPVIVWPEDTDPVFTADSKLLLNKQPPVLRLVIQGAIENLRAAILFHSSFPDVYAAHTLVKDSLLTAANHLKPGAADIYERLRRDPEYMSAILPLVRHI